MNLRRYLVDALPVWALLFLAMLAYVLAFIEPATTGRNWWALCGELGQISQEAPDCTDFLPDSVLYVDTADNFTLADIKERVSSLTPFKEVTLYWQAELAQWIAPSYQHTVIFVMNFAIFMATVALLCQTLDRLELTLPPIGFAVAILNPFMLFLVLTLNKDIWCFFAVAGAAYAATRRSLSLLLLFVAIAVFVRDTFAVMIISTYAVSRRWMGIGTFVLVGALALNLLPFVPGMREKLEFRDLLPELQGLNTTWLWQDMDWLQLNVPFGQLLVFPVTFLINVVGNSIAPSTWERILSYGAVASIVSATSSFMFTCVVARLVLAGDRRWTDGHKFLFRQGTILAYIMTAFPVIEQRYYLPAYLFFAILVSAKSKSQPLSPAHAPTVAYA